MFPLSTTTTALVRSSCSAAGTQTAQQISVASRPSGTLIGCDAGVSLPPLLQLQGTASVLSRNALAPRKSRHLNFSEVASASTSALTSTSSFTTSSGSCGLPIVPQGSQPDTYQHSAQMGVTPVASGVPANASPAAGISPALPPNDAHDVQGVPLNEHGCVHSNMHAHVLPQQQPQPQQPTGYMLPVAPDVPSTHLAPHPPRASSSASNPCSHLSSAASNGSSASQVSQQNAASSSSSSAFLLPTSATTCTHSPNSKTAEQASAADSCSAAASTPSCDAWWLP